MEALILVQNCVNYTTRADAQNCFQSMTDRFTVNHNPVYVKYEIKSLNSEGWDIQASYKKDDTSI